MRRQQQPTWYHSNRYNAEAACQHCGGVLRHTPWCITHNSRVLQAYEAVLDAEKLSVEDQLILHALGVSWQTPCAGGCKGPKE